MGIDGTENRRRDDDMLIPEEKLNEMVRAEIKSQIENKLKQYGKNTIKELYKDVISQEVRTFLYEQKLDLVELIKQEIKYNPEEWKKNIVDDVAEELTLRIEDAFRNYDSNSY